MSFKFSVGQPVEYTPIGGKVGLYKIVRRMPEEPQSTDNRYRIKSESEGYERNVLECQLNSDVGPASAYSHEPQPRRAGGGH